MYTPNLLRSALGNIAHFHSPLPPLLLVLLLLLLLPLLLLFAGVPGLHMYTLNLERSAVGILEAVGVLDTSKVPRSLPWRQVPSTRPGEVRDGKAAAVNGDAAPAADAVVIADGGSDGSSKAAAAAAAAPAGEDAVEEVAAAVGAVAV
jgi:hypothetical protein